MYIVPLRDANPPIIDPSKLEQFIHEVFNNFTELFHHHRNLVEKFHVIQRDEHPVIQSITAAVFDAALNFRDAYLQYIPNYPIAAYRIDDEMANNPAFKAFVDVGFVYMTPSQTALTSALAMCTTPRCSSVGHEELHQSTYPKVASL